MNKTVFFAVFMLFFATVSLNAMEQVATPVEPAPETIAKICDNCPVKSAIFKVFEWCKSHPIYLAVGVSTAAILAIYLTCPFVKNKVRESLGLESHQDDLRFEPCFCDVLVEQEPKVDMEQVKLGNDQVDELNPLCEL